MASTSSSKSRERSGKAEVIGEKQRGSRRRAGRGPVSSAPIQHMTDADVDRAVHLLAHWPYDSKYGKLTWGRLIDQLALTGPTWTRQTLFAKPEIAAAFQEAKSQLRGEPRRDPRDAIPDPEASIDPAVGVLQKKVTSLETEVERLNRILRDYDERFIRFQYNAQRRGVSIAELNMPLPPSPDDSGTREDRSKGKRAS